MSATTTSAALDAIVSTFAADSVISPATRTVAIYRTRATDTDPAEKSEEDAELTSLLANLPEEAGPQVRAMIERISSSENLDRLRQMRDMMGAQMSSGDDAGGQAAIGRYMLKQVEARLAQLESTQKEAK